MRKLFHSLLIAAAFWCGDAHSLRAQQPAPPPEQAKPAEPAAPPSRDGASMLVAYTLAFLGILVVLLLLCVPARRD